MPPRRKGIRKRKQTARAAEAAPPPPPPPRTGLRVKVSLPANTTLALALQPSPLDPQTQKPFVLARCKWHLLAQLDKEYKKMFSNYRRNMPLIKADIQHMVYATAPIFGRLEEKCGVAVIWIVRAATRGRFDVSGPRSGSRRPSEHLSERSAA